MVYCRIEISGRQKGACLKNVDIAGALRKISKALVRDGRTPAVNGIAFEKQPDQCAGRHSVGLLRNAILRKTGILADIYRYSRKLG
jgi:hypothetical protein